MLRKNTAGQNLGFVLVDAATGGARTGATVTTYRAIDGGAQAAATGTVTEKGNGQYNFAPSAADTNGNQISYLWVATGAVPAEKTVVTTAADPTNAASFGLTNLDSTVSGVPGAVWVAPGRTLTAFGFNPVVTLTAGAQTSLVSAVASAILATPANLIQTDAAGKVGANNLPADYQQRGVAVTLPSIPAGWITSTGIAAAAFNGKGDWLTGLGTTAPAGWINAAAVAPAALAGKGDWNTVAPDNTHISSIYTLVNGWAEATDATQISAHALALAPAASGGGAVTVSGYAAGMDPASQVLTTPAHKLTTDVAGNVAASNLPADYQQRGAAVTLPAIPANWITAAGINASALAGKGDWNTVAPDNADIAAIKVKTDALPAVWPAVDGSGHVTLAPAGLDQVKIEGLYNVRQVLGLAAAILNGLASGLDQDAPVFKGIGTGPTGPTRVSATTDASGNRTAVTLSPEA